MKGEEIFQSGMEYHSILFQEDEEKFRRYDLCSTCWQNNDQKEFMDGACTHWVSRIADKPIQDELVTDRNDRALELLKEGLEGGDPVKNMLLAMMLRRKKHMQYRQELVKEDGNIYHLYEVPSTEEMIAVPQVSIAESDIEAIQHQIMQELQ
jgi:hypothetical protein